MSEGRETVSLTLSTPTDGARLGLAAATLTINPSDGKVVTATDKVPSTKFTDADGDTVTVKLGGKVGTATVFLTNGKGPIALLDLAGTDPTRSVITLADVKPRGVVTDGRVQIGEIHLASGAKVLNLAKADLVGTGLTVDGFLGSLTLGDVKNGADITLSGTATNARGTLLATRVALGVVGDGTDLAVAAPLASLRAVAIGAGTIAAPSVGAIAVTGRAKTKAAAAIPGDFRSDLTVAGTGLASARVPALRSLRVAGAVAGSTIAVGGPAGTSGDVGSVAAGSFVGSRLRAGYAGPDDGTGAFNLPGTVKSFKVTGAVDAFARSFLVASSFAAVTLASVKADNGGAEFGVRADVRVGKLTVTSLRFRYDPADPSPQGVQDFDVRVV